MSLPISQLPKAALPLSSTDILVVDQPDFTTPSGLRTKRATVGDVPSMSFQAAGTGSQTRTIQNTLRDTLNAASYLDPVQLGYIAQGNLAAQNRTLVQTGVMAAITAAAAQGRWCWLPGGNIGINGNMGPVPDGTMLVGQGSLTSAAGVTRIDASTNTGSNPAIYTVNASDVTFRNFYLNGRTSGSGNELENQGNCRRIIYESLAVVSSTTGSGICFAFGANYCQTSGAHNVVCAGVGTGFSSSAASTSISLQTTYGNVCTVDGYAMQGTYLFYGGTAADGNAHFGYNHQNAVCVFMGGCGAELNGKGAFVFSASRHIVGCGFRSVSNNTAGSASNYSLATINDSSRDLYFTGVEDTTPNAATVNAIGNSSGSVGERISFRGDYSLGMTSTVRARTLAMDTMYAMVLVDGTGAGPTLTPIASRLATLTTKNGTGDITVTFPAVPPGFTVMASATAAGNGSTSVVAELVAMTSTTARIRTRVAGVLTDSPLVNIFIYAL